MASSLQDLANRTPITPGRVAPLLRESAVQNQRLPFLARQQRREVASNGLADGSSMENFDAPLALLKMRGDGLFHVTRSGRPTNG